MKRVVVNMKRLDDLFHGALAIISASRRAVETSSRELRELLEDSPPTRSNTPPQTRGELFPLVTETSMSEAEREKLARVCLESLVETF